MNIRWVAVLWIGFPFLWMRHGSGASMFSSSIGYQGAFKEQISGASVLGKGVRSLSPTLRRFIQADAGFSPFGLGGVNNSAYVMDNAVNFHDKRGHGIGSSRPKQEDKVDEIISVREGVLGEEQIKEYYLKDQLKNWFELDAKEYYTRIGVVSPIKIFRKDELFFMEMRAEIPITVGDNHAQDEIVSFDIYGIRGEGDKTLFVVSDRRFDRAAEKITDNTGIPKDHILRANVVFDRVSSEKEADKDQVFQMMSGDLTWLQNLKKRFHKLDTIRLAFHEDYGFGFVLEKTFNQGDEAWVKRSLLQYASVKRI